MTPKGRTRVSWVRLPSRMRLACRRAIGRAALLLCVHGLSRDARAQSAASQSAPAQTALSLADAVAAALRNHPVVAAAEAQRDQQNARLDQARAAFFPSVSGALGNRQRTFNTAELGIPFPAGPGQRPLFDPAGEVLGPINVYDARLRISQQLYAPAVTAQVRAARSVISRADAEVEVQREAVAAAAALAYVRVQRAAALVDARVADSTLSSDLVSISREQVRAGIGINLDVTRAESQLSAARAQVTGARAELRRSQLALFRATGLPSGSAISVIERLPDSSNVLPAVLHDVAGDAIDAEQAKRVALTQRAELRLMEAQRRSAEGLMRAVSAERLPSLSAFADNGYVGRGADLLRYTYSWGLLVSVPVLDVRRGARSREQAFVLRELDARTRDVERSVEMEVEAALLEVVAAREMAFAAADRRQLAEQELAQARHRFSAGVAGNTEVITASLSLNLARSALIDANAAIASATIELLRAAGRVSSLARPRPR